MQEDIVDRMRECAEMYGDWRKLPDGGFVTVYKLGSGSYVGLLLEAAREIERLRQHLADS